LIENLRTQGYELQGFDPYNLDFQKAPKNKFDLCVCFEVFKHCLSFANTQRNLKFLKDQGILLFSTLLLPQNIETIRISWWYIVPRNGHISIYTACSLQKLTEQLGFTWTFFSSNQNLHLIFKANNPPLKLLRKLGFNC